MDWKRYWWDASAVTAVRSFRAPVDLPPNSTCTAEIVRIKGGPSTSTTFRVVWGDRTGATHYVEPPTRGTLWPHPEDGARDTTFAFHVRTPGTYRIAVAPEYRNRSLAEVDFGRLDPGRHMWTWDGRDARNRIAPERAYEIEFAHTPEGGAGISREVWVVDVRIGPDFQTVRDRRGERRSDHVDFKALDMYSSRRRLELTVRFHSLRTADLNHMNLSIDVDKAEKGYLLTRVRKPGGVFKTKLQWAYLASDVGRPTTIRCRGLGVDQRRRSVTFTIPRGCMNRGGRAARVHASVSDRHYHYDDLPGGRSYWTPWLRYEAPG